MVFKHGGKRINSGRKKAEPNKATKIISFRVPILLADQLKIIVNKWIKENKNNV